MWKLSISGTVKSLAEWGVQNVSLRRQNMAGDFLTFTAPRRTYAAAPLLAYGATVKLIRETNGQDVTWFTGTNQTIPSSAEAAQQADAFTIASPWRWLAQNVFQQPWYGGTVYTSHILMLGTIGNNIKAVLDYAIASGAPLSYVAADLAKLNVYPPANEFTEKTCAQAILENLQFNPDVVVWFNHTTSPHPTLRFVRRAELEDVSVRLASHTADTTLEKVSAVTLTPRYDLQIPSAKINIEVIEEVDGVQRLIPGVDIYPPTATGREDGAFNATITVQGRTVNTVEGTLFCEQIDTSSVAWWARHIDAFRSSLVDVLAGPMEVKHYNRDGVEMAEGQRLPRELLQDGGGIALWMNVDSQVEVIRARFLIETYGLDEITGAPTSTPIRTEEREYSVELVTTDAPAGGSRYSTVASSDSGDPVPTGLAEYIYTSLAELHYEGGFTLSQSQCDAAVDLGYVVNLLGGQAGHATMRALVQEATFDIDTGTTRIAVGPPRHLGLSDLLALLQRFRVRRRWTNPDTQDTGEVSGSGDGALELPRATGGANSAPGPAVPKLFTVLDGGNVIEMNGETGRLTVGGSNSAAVYTSVAAGLVDIIKSPQSCSIDGGQITLGSSAAGSGSVDIDVNATNGKHLAIREMRVCVNGQIKHVMGLFSDIY